MLWDKCDEGEDRKMNTLSEYKCFEKNMIKPSKIDKEEY